MVYKKRRREEVHYSSKSAEWETPPWLFERLDEIFDFTLDPAATRKNALCEKYYTREDDGLSKNWMGERSFLNPPYGREIKYWVEKAAETGYYCKMQKLFKPNLKFRKGRTLVVVLMPARTDTIWMHEHVYGEILQVDFNDFYGAEFILDLKGRLKFQNRALPSYKEDLSHLISPAPFPSRLVFFGEIYEWDVDKLASLGQILIPKRRAFTGALGKGV